jgi:hypothetical protein
MKDYPLIFYQEQTIRISIYKNRFHMAMDQALTPSPNICPSE